jgi:O-antigen/teichoic acid export membrane protein
MGPRIHTIVRNVLSNWMGFAVNAAVAMAMTPYILRQLGDVRYGVWVLTFSVIGYYGILDLGFRGGVNQYLTRYFSLRDYTRLNQTASSAFYALSGVGALICAISIAATYLAPGMLKIPPAMHRETVWCILVIGCAAGVQCAFFPFSAVFTATQRYDLSNAIGITTRLLSAGATWLALEAGYGLVALSIVTASATILDYVLRWRIAYKLVPELVISRMLVNRDRIREIAHFGLWNFLIAVSAYLTVHADTLVIGSMLSVSAIARYALASGLMRQMSDLIAPVSQVFYPMAVQFHMRGEKRELEQLYIHASRLLLILTGCIAIIAFTWAEDFYRIWVGPQYVTAGHFPSVATLLRFLVIGLFGTFGSAIAGQIIMGTGFIRVVAITAIAESVLSVAIAIVSIRSYGLLGVAAGAMTAALLVRLLVFPVFLHVRLGLSVWVWLRRAVPRPLAVALVMLAATRGIRWLNTPATWADLIVHGCLAAFVAALLIALLGLNDQERDSLLLKPARRIAERLAGLVRGRVPEQLAGDPRES